MAYPWAGFASIKFRHDERPLGTSDTRWRRQIRRDQSANLGSAADSILTLAVGSAQRSFEMHMEPTRFTALEALIGTTSTFVDWTRPTPDFRNAYLAEVEHVEDVAVVCSDSVTRRKVRARITLISQ